MIPGWKGRIDPSGDGDTRRWHQIVATPEAGAPAGVALVGFACDEGIRRPRYTDLTGPVSPSSDTISEWFATGAP